MSVGDRPIAGVLAVLAAAVFVAAFSAAAVMRPDSAADPAAAAARTAPATAQENSRLVTIAAPSLSKVAALPALHLPKARPAKSRPAEQPESAPSSAGPDHRAARGHGGAAGRPLGRARAAAEAAAQVERRPDVRHLRMIRRHTHGHERPSLRWAAVGLVVALAAGLGGWFVAERIAADPAAVPSVQKELAAGPARLKVSQDWAEVRSPPIFPGLAGAPAWTPYSGLATTVSVALVPADDPALVPNELVRGADGGLPRPERARVVGLEARAYRGVRPASPCSTSTRSRPPAACSRSSAAPATASRRRRRGASTG